jgi:AcrR family transcriptional regulator
MARAAVKKAETITTLLEAAKKVLRQNGHSGLSTRDVATAAGVPLSQIHYHFGSKQGMMLALFEYLNAQLLDRQQAMFGDAKLALSEQWDLACQYLDDDIASGYVRVLQELIAASWADTEVAKVIRAGIMGWVDLITKLTRKARRDLGGLGPFSPEEAAALIADAFIGAESLYLLGLERKGSPVRRALRRVGDLIRIAEIQGVMSCARSCQTGTDSSSVRASSSTTRSTATAQRRCCSFRPGVSCIRASTRRSCPISASGSAASPTMGAATANPTDQPMWRPTLSTIMSPTRLPSWTRPKRGRPSSSACLSQACSRASWPRTIPSA